MTTMLSDQGVREGLKFLHALECAVAVAAVVYVAERPAECVEADAGGRIEQRAEAGGPAQQLQPVRDGEPSPAAAGGDLDAARDGAEKLQQGGGLGAQERQAGVGGGVTALAGVLSVPGEVGGKGADDGPGDAGDDGLFHGWLLLLRTIAPGVITGAISGGLAGWLLSQYYIRKEDARRRRGGR